MNIKHVSRIALVSGALAATLLTAGCASMMSGATSVQLSGSQEVPPKTTAATGTASVTIAADKSVTGTIKTTGLTGTMAHIHDGAVGKNGPVIVPFTKTSDDTWTAAPNAKLTDAQYADYLAGNLYVNVHTAANPGGEIRGQIPAGK